MGKKETRPLADRFFASAQKLEDEAEERTSTDDPKWLRRQASKFRILARKREKGLEHKSAQKKRGQRRT